MTPTDQARNNVLVIFGLLSVAFGLVAVRLLDLQVASAHDAKELQSRYGARSDIRRGHSGFELADRGRIVDRHGRPLATSYRSFRLFCNPTLPHAVEEEYRLSLAHRAELLVHVLRDAGVRIDAAGENRIIDRAMTLEREFNGKIVTVQRMHLLDGLDPGQRRYASEILSNHGIRNFFFESALERVYPEGRLAAEIVGFTGHNAKDSDPIPKGRAGIERFVEQVLAGKNGDFICEKDAWSREFEVAGRWLSVPVDGAQLELTLDIRIQSVVDRALRQALEVDKRNCKSVTAVVLHAPTGDVLAMKSLPSYEPGDLKRKGFNMELTRCRAVEDIYVIGSVLKPFIVARAIEAGIVGWNQSFDIGGGAWTFRLPGRRGRRTLRDSHNGPSSLTVRNIVVQSSNIGMARIGFDTMKGKRLEAALASWNFEEPAPICMPSRQAGKFSRIADKNYNPLYSPVSLSFGQEIRVSPLVMASRFAVFANGGRYIDPAILKSVEIDGHRIQNERKFRPMLTPRVAEEMRGVLADVMRTRSHKRFETLPWSVAGKTGTAELIDHETTKADGLYNSSLAVFSPIQNPEVVVYVIFHKLRGSPHYGAQVAGPVVKDILAGVMPLLGVAKDR